MKTREFPYYDEQQVQALFPNMDKVVSVLNTDHKAQCAICASFNIGPGHSKILSVLGAMVFSTRATHQQCRKFLDYVVINEVVAKLWKDYNTNVIYTFKGSTLAIVRMEPRVVRKNQYLMSLDKEGYLTTPYSPEDF